jgi:hypothetical protein
MSAREKGRGGGLFLSGWSSRGPRPRARGKGGRNPRGHFVSTDPRRHRALSRFQSCFVRRGNGFVARPGSGVWCERNSDASGRHSQPGRQCEFHCEFSGDAASFIAGARVSCSNRPKNLLLATSGGAGAPPAGCWRNKMARRPITSHPPQTHRTPEVIAAESRCVRRDEEGCVPKRPGSGGGTPTPVL